MEKYNIYFWIKEDGYGSKFPLFYTNLEELDIDVKKHISILKDMYEDDGGFDDIEVHCISIISMDGKIFKEEVMYDNFSKCVKPCLVELQKE